MGIRYLKTYQYQWDLVTGLAAREDERYDEGRLRREMRSLMRRDQPNLFSSEGILLPNDPARTAARMARLLPECENHFLFSIRRQETHFFSRYAHDLPAFNEALARARGLPAGSFPAYSIEEAVSHEAIRCRWPDCAMTLQVPLQIFKAEAPCACLERRAKAIPYWFYDIQAVVTHFKQQFGAERIHFILLEETAEWPERTIDRLAKMLKLRLSTEAREALVKTPAKNTLVNNSGHSLDLLQAAYRAPDGLEAKVKEHYSASNRRLQAEFPDLPLAEYGYF